MFATHLQTARESHFAHPANHTSHAVQVSMCIYVCSYVSTLVLQPGCEAMSKFALEKGEWQHDVMVQTCLCLQINGS